MLSSVHMQGCYCCCCCIALELKTDKSNIRNIYIYFFPFTYHCKTLKADDEEKPCIFDEGSVEVRYIFVLSVVLWAKCVNTWQSTLKISCTKKWKIRLSFFFKSGAGQVCDHICMGSYWPMSFGIWLTGQCMRFYSKYEPNWSILCINE